MKLFRMFMILFIFMISFAGFPGILRAQNHQVVSQNADDFSISLEYGPWYYGFEKTEFAIDLTENSLAETDGALLGYRGQVSILKNMNIDGLGESLGALSLSGYYGAWYVNRIVHARRAR